MVANSKFVTSQQPDQPSYADTTCTASATYRTQKGDNQDSSAVAVNAKLSIRAIIVADGLGSYAYAREAAAEVCQNVKQQIECWTTFPDQLDFRSMFQEARDGLVELAKTYPQQLADHNQAFGTTLIVGLEHDQYVYFAYVGNGAIWHIRGNFNTFHSTKYLPWNALNYLNPHTVQNEQGKEALYKLIDLSDDPVSRMPTVLRIQKDQESYGDIFMICTDGIYSFDQVPIGKRVSDESIWISGERSMPRFFAALNSYFQQVADPPARLQTIMQGYVDELAADQILDDDATLGVFITSKAQESQISRSNSGVFRGEKSNTE